MIDIFQVICKMYSFLMSVAALNLLFLYFNIMLYDFLMLQQVCQHTVQMCFPIQGHVTWNHARIRSGEQNRNPLMLNCAEWASCPDLHLCALFGRAMCIILLFISYLWIYFTCDFWKHHQWNHCSIKLPYNTADKYLLSWSQRESVCKWSINVLLFN